MCAPQIHVYAQCDEECPEIFCKKIWVSPEIFNDILDQLSDHPIFQSNSNHPQFPVAIQLTIFLNCAGHYRNAISLEDVALWAGVGLGSVTNCTNHVMVAILDQHNNFIQFPPPNSHDCLWAKEFMKNSACPEWQGGFLAADGSAIPLFQKPGFYGETFFD
ncbi:hypothetical protein PAXRUDRAFT_168288 [Paxillus rubicundulus Ve08.2h10]|uniref:Unplaced genomic scaffold scaffold_2389, whole genome shotgun sequence n=1 Tax=Paxillus rubicundulus Ve08.2h10 TaxID=930991 RepID=A0A0D0C168_9AGAM|nr:hypothetical protein PAXRUDRAFT_168288 [Paxillus rubicundulus Ve08.2h10]